MSEEKQEDIQVFTCENCGGNMVFDIKSQALKFVRKPPHKCSRLHPSKLTSAISCGIHSLPDDNCGTNCIFLIEHDLNLEPYISPTIFTEFILQSENTALLAFSM